MRHRSPGVKDIAESLQSQRCRELEKLVQELRIENDALREDILRIRNKLQDFQVSSAFSSTSTPAKRDSGALRERERELLKLAEDDQETIRELLNLNVRLREELQAAQAAASMNEGLLKAFNMDEIARTMEAKERVILELSAELSELKHGGHESLACSAEAVFVHSPSAGDSLSLSSSEVRPEPVVFSVQSVDVQNDAAGVDFDGERQALAQKLEAALCVFSSDAS